MVLLLWGSLGHPFLEESKNMSSTCPKFLVRFPADPHLVHAWRISHSPAEGRDQSIDRRMGEPRANAPLTPPGRVRDLVPSSGCLGLSVWAGPK